MNQLAKILIATGVIFILVGLFVSLVGKIPGVGKLPGDILIKKENSTFYFPITTCILISVILSFILFLWNQR